MATTINEQRYVKITSEAAGSSNTTPAISVDPGPTPDPPLVLNPIIFPVGDSRGQQNWSTSTTYPAILSRSPLARIVARSRRVRMTHRYTMAKSGDTLEQCLYRLVNDVANEWGVKPSEVPPGVAGFLCGTNSANYYAAVATQYTVDEWVEVMYNQALAIIQWLLDHKHGVLLFAEWPRGNATDTTGALPSAACQMVLAKYASRLARLVKTNVFVANPLPRMLDRSNSAFNAAAGFLNVDWLHEGPGAAEVSAQEGKDAPRLFGLSELAFNNDGALNTNPDFQTLGGTLGTNAAAGSDVPLGYTLQASAGLTVAGKQVTINYRGEIVKAYRMIISGTPTAPNASAVLRQSGLQSLIAAGDWLEGGLECLVAPGAVNLSSPCLMVDTGVSASRLHGGLSITNDTMMAQELQQAWDGVTYSSQGKMDTVPTSLGFQCGAYLTLASVVSSATLYLIRGKTNKVTTPLGY